MGQHEEKFDAAARLAHAKKTFEQLAPRGWRLATSTNVKQGGKSGVCVVENEAGVKGVFRCLPPAPPEIEVKRFVRELKALASIDHPNVVKLIQFGADAPHWYITALGTGFKEYWSPIEATCQPEEIELRSLQVLRELASGLEACHKSGLVHRDIKPNNIVVYESNGAAVPVLIDFGVVWMPGEEPLTVKGQAVWNARYGADILRIRECPPWVDVFSLLQVFQWMVCEPGEKEHWQRPTHWRYVTYLEGLSPWFNNGIRVISAVCSLEETCPRNGGELLRLIAELMPDMKPGKKPMATIDESKIARGIADGKREVLLRQAKDAEVLEASKALAGARYPVLKEVLRRVERASPRTKPQTDREFAELFPLAYDNPNATEYYEFHCHASDTQHFTIRVLIHAFVPSRWPNGGKPEALESANLFACSIERCTRMPSPPHTFPYRIHHITLERNGGFVLRSSDWREILEQLSVERLEQLVSGLVEEPEAWRAITSGAPQG